MRGNRAIAIDARPERPRRRDTARVDRRIVLRGQYAGVRQRTARCDTHVALRVGRAAVVDAVARVRVDRAARVGLPGQYKPTARLQRQVACLRGQHPARADTDAVFVRRQKDAIRVHPAQRADIDRHRRRSAITGNCRRRQRVVVDLIRASDDVQVVRVDRGIDLNCAREQINLIDVLSIQPRALDRDVAARHVEA